MGLLAQADAAGKLLLFGEHAAVRGYPALGLSLGFRLRVSLECSGREGWPTPDLDGEEARLVREVLAVVSRVQPGAPSGGIVRIRGDLPLGQGFGSSAALCVALALACAEAADATGGGEAGAAIGRSGLAGTGEAGAQPAPSEAAWPSERDLGVWRAAHQAERIFHGTPSGIDTGLALLGGCIRFDMRPPEVPRAIRLPNPGLPLVVGAVPREGLAAALVGRVASAAAAGDADTLDALCRLGGIAEEAAQALAASGDAPSAGLFARLGDLAEAAELDLARLGLESPSQRALLETGRKLGALGGKLSGAGSGGAYWLIFPDKEAAKAALQPLEVLARSIPGALPPFLP